MRRRVEGNVSILEDENGNEILTAHIYGNTVVIQQGEWVMIRDLAAQAEQVLAVHASEEVTGSRFRFYDVSIELRSNIPWLRDDFGSMYSRFIRDELGDADLTITALSTDEESPRGFAMIMQTTPDRQLRLKGDFCEVSYLSCFEHLLFQVHQEAEVFLLTNNPNHMFIHSGTVERNGIGYMMPAESRHGKTTLTMALVQAGYNFMSDEFAVLDPSGTLLPFPRTLSVREDGLRLFPNLDASHNMFPLLYSPVDSLYSVDLLHAFSAEMGKPCRVQRIIFPNYDASADPAIRAIHRMEAVRRLVGTRGFISLGLAEKQSALDFLLSVLSDAECFDLVTGDLEKTIALVDGLGA